MTSQNVPKRVLKVAYKAFYLNQKSDFIRRCALFAIKIV